MSTPTSPPAPAIPAAPAAPRSSRPARPLGEVLLAHRWTERSALEHALASQREGDGGRVGQLLVDAGVLTPERLMLALAEQSGARVSDVGAETPTPEALGLLDHDTARREVALPLRVVDEVLLVAVPEPSSEIGRRLATAAARRVRLVLGGRDDIVAAIDHHYGKLAGVDDDVAAYEATRPHRAGDDSDGPAVVDVDASAPVVSIVERVVAQALHDRASDIHFEPTDSGLAVRFRVDGHLREALTLPPVLRAAVVSRLKVMAGMDVVDRRRPQDGHFEAIVEGRRVDVRVATTSTIRGEKAVLRLLDKRPALLDLEELGMDAGARHSFERLVRRRHGLIVAAGATGSGKTTSLYAGLKRIVSPELSVTTIEDPVEYRLDGISQIQIAEAAGLTFASGLRSILRQDPDVIMVGEIRDLETARIAIQASLTGHLVLSTIHAVDSASALHRFLDMGIEPYLVASAVSGVIGQRLVRRICDRCAAPVAVTPADRGGWRLLGGCGEPVGRRGAGCGECAGTGFLGRVGLFEVLPVTTGVSASLIAGGTNDDVRRVALDEGMQPFTEAALRLVAEGVTTIAEAVRATSLDTGMGS